MLVGSGLHCWRIHLTDQWSTVNTQHHHLHNAQSWADVVATFPPNVHVEPQPTLTNPSPRCAACGCNGHTAHGSSTPDLHSLLGPMLESLRSDLQKFLISQLEEVVRPLRAEASTIKLWLARMANHLEIIESPCKDPFVPDLVGLFGPCSPVRCSSAPTLLSACTPIRDFTFHDEKIVAVVDLNNVMENQNEQL